MPRFSPILKIFFLLALAWSLILPPDVQAYSPDNPPTTQDQPVNFETLNVADGLSQSTVWSILQDSQGFVWIGTEDGLNRYDGYAFQVFRHDGEEPASLRNNVIASLYEDSQGNLWVGTAEGLDRFDRQSETFIHYYDTPVDSDNLSANGVLAMLEDSQGNFWVGTAGGGLALLDRRTGAFRHFLHDGDDPRSISNNTVSSIIEIPDGTLWIGTANGLNQFEPLNGVFYRFYHNMYDESSISSDLINVLLKDRLGNLWVGTEGGGLNKFNLRSRQFEHLPVGSDDPEALNSSSVRALAEDSEGNIWVATRHGLDVILPENSLRVNHYHHDPNIAQTVASDNTLSLYAGRDGVLWVGTYGGGLSKYNRYANKFQVYQHSPNQETSLSDNLVFAIFEDNQHYLWVGTVDGGLNRIDRNSGEILVFRHDPSNIYSLSSDDVRAIYQDSRGAMWIGTGDGGLNRFNSATGKFTRFRYSPSYANSLSDNSITVIYEDSQRNMWVGTRNGGLNLLNKNGTFTHFAHDDENPYSLSDNYVRSIWEDDEGFLWIGTNNGLNRMHPLSHRIRRYRHNPRMAASLSSDTVLSVFQDSNGVLWVGTQVGGLNRLDWETETFVHYTEKNGLPNDTVYGILEDQQGFLWMSTNNGITRFDPHNEVFRNFDIRDGLQSNEFNAGAYFENNRGEMFFGGVNGLNSFNPATLVSNPNPPPIVITAFKEFNQLVRRSLVSGEQIEMDYSVNFISFEFVALDYNAPIKNEYSYMLEGFDKDWVPADSRRYVNYTNLKGGDYVFRVRGSNNDGLWNEQGVSVHIHVIPPFWQRWWFIGIVSFALGTLVWGGYYLRVKSVESLNRQLEQQVLERTQEIERRRQVAEGLRDIIAILNSNQSLEHSLQYIILQMIRLLGAETALLFQFDALKRVKIIASNIQNLAESGPSNPVPDWLVKRISANEAVVVPDIEKYQRVHVEAVEFPLAKKCALLAIPMAAGTSVDGGLMLVFREKRLFSDEDLKVGYTFADQAALAIANAQLRAHSEELAVSAERSRLARDLHDAVTQTLFATSIIAEVLPKIWERNADEGKRRLMEVRELTRGALAEMRTLLMELRPTALLDAPLGDLLQQLCDAFRGRARIPVQFTSNANVPLSPEAQLVFYRIAQEALNNVARHARASQVEMSLTCDAHNVVLEVKDDGVGFDMSSTPPDHFGLNIMRERAQTIGAVCRVESQPGAGTRIQLEWQNGKSDLNS